MSRLRRLRNYGSTFRRRSLVILLVVALLACVCIVRLAYVQLYKGEYYSSQATSARLYTRTTQAIRGEITDDSGEVLAQSVQRYTIYVDQNGARNFTPIKCTGTNSSTCHSINGKNVTGKGPAAVAKMLAPLLKMDVNELGAELSGDNSYVVVKKNVKPAVKRKIDALNLSGVVGSELTIKRIYPNPTLLGTVLGGTNDEGTGSAGIESMQDKSLKGISGKETYQKGNLGQKIPGTEETSVASKNGGTTTLTINSDVQWYVDKMLKEGQEEQNADWGIAVVQEVSTGKIIAIADTDQYAAGTTDAVTHTSRAITTTFEPGSTGKLITASGLIQTGLHTGSDKFSVPYSITIDGQTYHDSHEHSTERLTLAGIMKESSNVGTILASTNYTLADRLKYIKKFGIGSSTGLNFPGESVGIVASKTSDWDARTQNTVLFGQGYTASALQMTNVVVTIANGGVRMGQSIIASSTDANGKDTTPTPNKSVRVIDKSTAADMMDMMESMADEYSKYVGVNGYRVAGKSGTAETADSSGNLTEITADFIGVYPADNPKYVVTVVLRNPDDTYGGITAGPIVGKIGEFLMQKYQVATSSARTSAISTTW